MMMTMSIITTPKVVLRIMIVVIFLSQIVVSQSIINTLPGYPGELPFKLETGYIGIGETEDVHLFYYFIESERNPRNDPLIIWISGGPGCSPLFDLFYEIANSNSRAGISPTSNKVWGHFVEKKAYNYLHEFMIKVKSNNKGVKVVRLNEDVKVVVPLIHYRVSDTPNDITAGTVTFSGPLCFNYAKSKWDKLTLELNPYSWTKVANIIFLDQPVGTGFSYADSIEAWKTSDTLSATQTYNFLKKWLRNHPKFYNNPLYVGGISYAGIVIPAIVQNIYTGNENGNETPLNIKGYMIANPLTDKFIDFNSRVQAAHRLALLSDELFKSSKETCQGDYIQSNSTNGFCQNDLKAINKRLDRINQAHVLEPPCGKIETPNSKVLKGDGASYEDNPISMETWCRDDTYVFMTMWAKDKTVQKALHIREGTIREWTRCNLDFSFEKSTSIYYTFNIRSSVNYHRNLTSKRCRALIFSGDYDLIFPYVGTEKWIRSLNLNVKNNWDPWFIGNQVAGYTSTFSHNDYSLIFATVKGAGHTVPEYKPKECLAMAERWFADYPL